MRLGVAFALVCLLSLGCTTPAPARPEVLPALDDLVSAHNARVGQLDRLWARTSVRVEGRDAEGSKFAEQGEGHLQVERPDSVSVTIGKLSEVYFAIGSNAERYWLFDLSGDDRVLVWGEQELATPEKAAVLGLPVHPRDLPMLLGLSPIDPEGDLRGPFWNNQDQAAIIVPSRWGSAAMRFDPRTGELVGTAAYNAAGEIVAEAELGRVGDVMDDSGFVVSGRLARKVEIRVPGFDGFVRMELDGLRVKAINPAVFDPDRLRRAYRVRTERSLDEAPSESGASGVQAD